MALGGLPAIGLASASPNTVLVLTKDYSASTTTVDRASGTPVTQTSRKTSRNPVSVALTADQVHGAATAGAFYVSAATGGHLGTAAASATSSVTFATLAGQRAPLSFDWIDLGLPFYSFSATIVDVVTHQDVFSLDYTLGQGVLPLQGTTGSIAIDSLLMPFHLYTVTLDISTSSADDNESLQIGIDGLNPLVFGKAQASAGPFADDADPAAPVPEPAPALMLLGGLALWFVRRSRPSSSRTGA